jgi:hypothetical protein
MTNVGVNTIIIGGIEENTYQNKSELSLDLSNVTR